MRAAVVQMTSTSDKDANLATARRLVGDAVDNGAELVVLPEMFNLVGTEPELGAGAEPRDGPTITWALRLARDHGIWLVAGSIAERAHPRGRHNTCCVVSPRGNVGAVYRKVHLFDVDIEGFRYAESANVMPGDDLVVVDADGLPLGLSICYDVRFPELFRILALRGAQVIAMPSAFTALTGPAHWEVLLRARAIENQVFVLAPDQHGASNGTLRWHGHSMIVDPWGTVIAEVGDGDGVAVADLDLGRLAEVRRRVPSFENRRPDAYRWPGGEG